MKVPLTRQLSRSSASISHPPARLSASSVAAEKLKLHWAAERQQFVAPEHSMSIIYIYTHIYHLNGEGNREEKQLISHSVLDKKEAQQRTNLRWTQQLNGWWAPK